jgi:hypothetical protein
MRANAVPDRLESLVDVVLEQAGTHEFRSIEKAVCKGPCLRGDDKKEKRACPR